MCTTTLWQSQIALVAAIFLATGPVAAQQKPAAPTRTPPAPNRSTSATAPAPTTSPGATVLKAEELDQLAAQIALYPDSVLAQVLMASTYPLEVVQADRFAQANKSLTGEKLTAELEKQNWDPSVKSLVAFPQVLEMMNKQLDWTTKLGDAFIADQGAVMAAVQRLRARAHAQGNLKTTPEQKVIIEAPEPIPAPSTPTVVVVENAPPPPPQIIKIESPAPETVYVPVYNPTVVYGAWPYPAYPPYPPYYPPGYVATTAAISFGVGVAVGAAWGYAWGGCHWGSGHGEIDIDVDRNTNINRNINRESYRQNVQNRQTNRQTGGGRNTFQHDPAHRKGVSYRDQNTANRFNGAGNRDAARARDDFRGRAETGRQDISRGGAGQFQRDIASGRGDRYGAGGRTDAGRNTAAARDRSTYGGGRDSVGSRDSVGGRSGSGSDRSSFNGGGRGGNSGGGAFDGAGRTSGSSARDYSSRGSSSRSSASSSPSRSRSSGSSGGGGRSFSGGGGRGGGGGGRGGGRR